MLHVANRLRYLACYFTVGSPYSEYIVDCHGLISFRKSISLYPILTGLREEIASNAAKLNPAATQASRLTAPSASTNAPTAAPVVEGSLASGKLGESRTVEYRWQLAELGLKPPAQLTFWAAASDYLPQVDSCVHGLLTDLADRGMLETTLVILCGEFSRTPRMNDGGNGGAPGSMGTPGRDHWGDSMFCLMGGGGVKGGMIVGSTDRLGERPKDRPLTPSNIHATIYEILGVDPKLQLLDPSGRPVNVLEDPTAIAELL